jgi:hypothetical protein
VPRAPDFVSDGARSGSRRSDGQLRRVVLLCLKQKQESESLDWLFAHVLCAFVTAQVIIQVWISTHFGVISESPPPRMRGFLSSRPALLLVRSAVNPHFDEFFGLLPSRRPSCHVGLPPQDGRYQPQFLRGSELRTKDYRSPALCLPSLVSTYRIASIYLACSSWVPIGCLVSTYPGPNEHGADA